MTVTEFAVLQLLEPHTIASPSIRSFFIKLSQCQGAWSGYPLLFFQHHTSPKTIYLVSGWRDVPAHNDWIASDGNQELLREADPILAVIDFRHLQIDFETLPQDVSQMTLEILPHGLSGAEGNADSIADVGCRHSEVLWQGTGRALEEPLKGWYRLTWYRWSKELETVGSGDQAEETRGLDADGVERKKASEVVMRRIALA
jgi:hypothetical protein